MTIIAGVEMLGLKWSKIRDIFFTDLKKHKSSSQMIMKKCVYNLVYLITLFFLWKNLCFTLISFIYILLILMFLFSEFKCLYFIKVKRFMYSMYTHTNLRTAVKINVV